MTDTLTYIRPMSLKDNLKRLMDGAGVSQNGLADATKVPQPTIFRILQGESRDPRNSTLKPIADYFGITVAQLRGDEHMPLELPVAKWERPAMPVPGTPIRPYDLVEELDPDHYVLVDRYDVQLSAGCGNVQWVVNQKDPIAFRARWFQQKRIKPDACRALYVRGRSMEPMLQDWDTVLIDTAQTDLIDGEVYAVCLHDEFYIKAVYRTVGGVVLKSSNQDFENIEARGEELSNFCVIGKMVWRGG